MGNKIMTTWYRCDKCKKRKHGFDFDIAENGSISMCDECKKLKSTNKKKEEQE